MSANISSLDLNLLLALDALYEERSVTRAADRLALTQPTVSGMLKRLRILFDDELYIRTSHGVVPTPRAEALSGPVRELIESAHAMLRPQSFDPSVETFEVKFYGSDYIHSTLFGPLASDIMSKAPGARVLLALHPHDNLDQLLVQGEADILFSTHDPTTPKPDGLVLYQDELACVTSYRAHKHKQNIDLEELCGLSHIVLAQFGSRVSQRIDTMLAERNLSRNIVVRVPNFSAVFQAMAHSELVAFMPGHMVRQYARDTKQLRTNLELPMTDVIARWHPRMEQDPRHRWLRERVRETARNMAHK
ncbi:MAG: LysR family transcriptional regulator [Pseudomonadota bacterium]